MYQYYTGEVGTIEGTFGTSGKFRVSSESVYRVRFQLFTDLEQNVSCEKFITGYIILYKLKF